MNISGAFDSEAIEVTPWSAAEGPMVFHYSTSSHTRFTRPLSDWVALFTAGVIITGAIYFLLFAMAMHPII